MGKKFVLLLAALAAGAWAANLRLYMADGTYQVVREYKVENDRVRFYSVERSGWEEVPATLVDLKRTETEAKARQSEIEKETKVLSEEDAAARAIQKEVLRIPQNPGTYWIDGAETKIIKQAEPVVHTNKGREWLKILSPIPAVSGKGWLELQETHSRTVITNPSQEFFIQLSETERFGMVKLRPRGEYRVVEDLTFVPVTKQVLEQPVMVDILTQQMTPDGLYKIWPKDPLPNGEYAVVEYTDGKMNMQVWDFEVKVGK
jgi:hypothetical protein